MAFVWTSYEAKNRRNGFKIDIGEKMLKVFSHPYFQDIVAPDPLLTEDCKRSIEPYFLQFWDELEGIEITPQRSAFNASTKSLNAMSSVYTAISVMLLILLATKLLRVMSAFNFFRLVLRLISLTLWWPALQTYGVMAAKYIHGSHSKK